MRRIFTSTFFVAAFVVASFNSFGQTCNTGVSFMPSFTYTFDNNSQQFVGDFSQSGGSLVSTNVGAGPTKVLTSPTFTQPASQPTIAWGFTLAGSANVTSYVVDALYYNGTSIQSVNICSGTTIANGTRTFSGTAPAQILGQNFKLRITFTVSGGNGNTLSIDNFASSAQISNTALPVKFQALDAKAVNNSISLKWSVGTEDNVSSYQVEKSTDGHSYSTIGFVKASGEGSYLFVDSKLVSVAYYRIKSVDVNGRYGYSTVAFVKSGQSTIVLKAFPTPFVNNLSIQHPTAVAGSSITISSADGRVIKTIVPAVGMQQTDINLSSAKSGMYVIRYSSINGDSETLKVVKQ